MDYGLEFTTSGDPFSKVSRCERVGSASKCVDPKKDYGLRFITSRNPFLEALLTIDYAWNEQSDLHTSQFMNNTRSESFALGFITKELGT